VLRLSEVSAGTQAPTLRKASHRNNGICIGHEGGAAGGQPYGWVAAQRVCREKAQQGAPNRDRKWCVCGGVGVGVSDILCLREVVLILKIGRNNHNVPHQVHLH
jgi:hypothetical protein